MATTLTTYLYEGSNTSDFALTYICSVSCYITSYIDVAIFYGNYIGADVVPSVQPKNLPPLSNVEFKAEVWRTNGSGHPLSRHSAARLIARQDIFNQANPADCIGTKFTFQSIMMNDCANEYCLVWSTNRIEMPYGPDMIYIGAQSGVSNEWAPCDLI